MPSFFFNIHKFEPIWMSIVQKLDRFKGFPNCYCVTSQSRYPLSSELFSLYKYTCIYNVNVFFTLYIFHSSLWLNNKVFGVQNKQGGKNKRGI